MQSEQTAAAKTVRERRLRNSILKSFFGAYIDDKSGLVRLLRRECLHLPLY
jgi:hypothetical protein